MLSASKKITCLNNAVKRLFASRSLNVSANSIHAGRNWPKNDRPTFRLDFRPNSTPNFATRNTYVTLTSSRFEVANQAEAATETKTAEDLKSSELKEEFSDIVEKKSRSSENVTRSKRQGSNRPISTGRFRNYSYSDYQTVESLRQEFEELLNKQDGSVSPVTAYQFIRNCGNKMSVEPPENRTALAQEIWNKLKERGVQLETTHYNTLLSVFIQNRHQFSPLDFLADMQEHKVQPDKSTYMLIVQAYCQEGDLTGALRVIDFMTKQEIPVLEPIYTALVTGHSKNNDMEGACKILETMRENNIIPQVDTYTALIAGYASKGDLTGIDKVFEEMEEKNIHTNTLLYMNMLDSFCRSGHSDMIPEGLRKIKHKASVEMEMRYFLERLISRGDYESAAIVAKNNALWLPTDFLRQDEMSAQNLFLYRLMRVRKPLDEIIRAMKVLEAHEITSSPLEDVMEICYGTKATGDAIKMLDVLKEAGRPVKSHYVYPILCQLADNGDLEGILNMIRYMGENKIKIDAYTIDFGAKGFKDAEPERHSEFMQLAEDMGAKIPRKVFSGNLDLVLNGNNLQAFIDIVPAVNMSAIGTRDASDKVTEFLIRTFDAKETPRAIIALDQKNLYRLGWILSKILEPFNREDPERAKDAFKIFKALVNADAMKGLNTYCFTLLLNTFFKNSMRSEFFEVVNVMKEQGIEPNEAQYFIMMKMSSLIGNSAAAQFCFDKLKALHEPTEAQYNALLIAYGKDNGKGKANDEPNDQYIKKVITLYEEMREKDFKPLGLAVSQILVAYLNQGNLEAAEEVKRLHGLGVTYRRYAVYNEQLRAYAKLGNAEEAEKLMQEVKDSDIENLISLFTYNQLIGVHKQTGNLERVMEIFKEVEQQGFTPNRVTYSEIIKTCIRRNEPEKALEVLESITDMDRLPAANVLHALTVEFFEKTDVENCERTIALIRKRTIDEWAEQRLKHILLMLYLKDNNFTAAVDIITKDDFRLTQRLIMSALGQGYKDLDYLNKVKDFLRNNNANYFLMDLGILNAHIADNNVDAALQLYNEKKKGDTLMTNYFLSKLANFLTASGKEVPFDTSILAKKKPREVNLEVSETTEIEELQEQSIVSDESVMTEELEAKITDKE